MPALSPLSCPQRGVRAEHVPALAELRAAIHRATAGELAHGEHAERQRFADGVRVSETSISCWAATVGPLVGPLRLPRAVLRLVAADSRRLRR